MDLFHAGLLFGAGIVGGLISALAGGASIVTFPALLAAGLPPVTAVATNVSAFAPALLLAVFTEREKLPPMNRSFLGLILVSGIGTVMGAALLLATPERLFGMLVPLLLAIGTLLLAVSGRVRDWMKKRSGHNKADRRLSASLILPVSIYSGYFGAGAGVMLAGVTSLEAEDYRQANAMKNVMTLTTTTAAIIVYAASGTLDWPATFLLGGGGILGGIAGVRLARIVPQDRMRMIVVVFGVVLTLTYAWRYWL